MIAFRCKTCGHLHAAEHAGLHTLPRSCQVCGKGVRWEENGTQTLQSENWEVLAEATPERLLELGLTPEEVIEHQPDSEKDRLHNLQRVQAAHAQLAEKEKLWKSKLLEEWQTQLAALHDQLDTLDATEIDSNDLRAYARQEHARVTLQQQITDLLNVEWTERDVAHRKELDDAIAREGRPHHGPLRPQQFRRQTRQRQGFSEAT